MNLGMPVLIRRSRESAGLSGESFERHEKESLRCATQSKLVRARPCAGHPRLAGATEKAIAVGRPLLDAPRTDPYVRLSRIRLPPRVLDGEALGWPRVEDRGLGEPVVGDLLNAVPDQGAGLAAAAQRAPPMPDDALPEGRQRAAVGRHGVVVEETHDDLLEPFALLGDGVVHAPAQTLLDLLELRPQPTAAARSPQEKLAGPRRAADQREAEEVEGLRFTQPAPGASGRCEATRLDQAGLSGCSASANSSNRRPSTSSASR